MSSLNFSRLGDEHIINRAYIFLKENAIMISKIPRTHKFVFGDRLYQACLDLVDLYIHAYYSSKETKLQALYQSNIVLERIRIYLRLAYDLGIISSHKRNELIEQTMHLGRMTGGWINSIKK